MVDEQADEGAPDHLGEQHLDLGLRLGETGLDVGLDPAHVHLHSFMKKSGRAPAFRNLRPCGRDESCAVQISTAEAYAAFAARSR